MLCCIRNPANVFASLASQHNWCEGSNFIAHKAASRSAKREIVVRSGFGDDYDMCFCCLDSPNSWSSVTDRRQSHWNLIRVLCIADTLGLLCYLHTTQESSAFVPPAVCLRTLGTEIIPLLFQDLKASKLYTCVGVHVNIRTWTVTEGFHAWEAQWDKDGEINYLSMRAAASICSFQTANKTDEIQTSSVGGGHRFKALRGEYWRRTV